MTDRRLRSVVLMLRWYLDTNICPQVLHTIHIRRPPLFARSLSTCSVCCKFRRNGFTQANTATALDRFGPVAAWAWPFLVDLLYDLHLWFRPALFRSSNAYSPAPVSQATLLLKIRKGNPRLNTLIRVIKSHLNIHINILS